MTAPWYIGAYIEHKLLNKFPNDKNRQKQPTRGVPRKRCSAIVQQMNRKTPMPKCDFNKVALQLY